MDELWTLFWAITSERNRKLIEVEKDLFFRESRVKSERHRRTWRWRWVFGERMRNVLFPFSLLPFQEFLAGPIFSSKNLFSRGQLSFQNRKKENPCKYSSFRPTTRSWVTDLDFSHDTLSRLGPPSFFWPPDSRPQETAGEKILSPLNWQKMHNLPSLPYLSLLLSWEDY